MLGKFEYFGQYGTILKIVVNKTKAYNPNGPNGPSYSAYISYVTEQEASIAILAIDNIEVDDHILRASYGTTKYCTFFLKNLDCPNKDCLYLHHLAEDSDIINRDDMNSNTNIFYEQQLLAMKLADIFNVDVKKKLKAINTKKKCVLPTTDSIFTKDIVQEQNNQYNEYKYYDREYKYKKKYNDYYDDGYYSRYSEHYENDNDYFYEQGEEKDNYLHRDKSENFTTKTTSSGIKNKPKLSNLDEDNGIKFISKSKSPMTTKKKNIGHEEHMKSFNYNNSVSPGKIDIENKIIYNENIGNPNSSNNISVVSSNLNNNNTTSHVNNYPKKLYRKRDESRFSFAKNDNCNLNVIKTNEFSISKVQKDNLVPDFVSDVICKKISRHTFFKKFENFFEKENNDYLFVQKHLRPDDSWSKFILSNMETPKNNKII